MSPSVMRVSEAPEGNLRDGHQPKPNTRLLANLSIVRARKPKVSKESGARHNINNISISDFLWTVWFQITINTIRFLWFTPASSYFPT